MRQVASALLDVLLACSLVGCWQPQDPPPDFQPKMLDPKVGVQEADTIVLGYPTVRRDVSSVFSIRGAAPYLKVIETETTLVVQQALKGATLPKELKFRHYSDYPFLSGPPQGPSGHMGERGIFFLRRQPTGTFRSAVDIYRPDIPTRWITGSSKAVPCSDPRDCVARVLLSFGQGDEADSFAAGLQTGNALLSLPLIGFLKTFQLLNELVQERYPHQVRLLACTRLSSMYALEFPSQCRALIAGTRAEQEYTHRVAILRGRLKEGGVAWLQGGRQFDPKGPTETLQDLELIAKSADLETRKVAETLLKSLKGRS